VNTAPALAGRALSHSRTVPRETAHRRAVSEVFVTDSVACGTDAALLGLQIPRAHSLWADRPAGPHDAFAVGEAARQAAFVFFHEHLDLAVGLPFSMQRWELAVLEPESLRDDERAPLEGEIHYRVTGRQVTAVRGSMTIEGTVRIDGQPALRVASEVAWASRRDYQALRDYQRGRKPLETAPYEAPVRYAPELVGRRDPRNVVIGPLDDAVGPGHHRLVVDLSHPAFFDHSYDHVPGPLMLEGLRQTALLTACRSGALTTPRAQLQGLAVGFTDFAEFEGPVDFRAEAPVPALDGSVAVTVAVVQFDAVVAQGEITLRP
jgi:hypothetical protein